MCRRTQNTYVDLQNMHLIRHQYVFIFSLKISMHIDASLSVDFLTL